MPIFYSGRKGLWEVFRSKSNIDGKELYVNLLGLRQNCSKWILDAAAGDRSRMHNRLAMDILGRNARLPYETDNAGRYSSMSRYVEVWGNGEYRGLFCLTATAGWVKEGQRRELRLILTQFAFTLFLYLFFQYLV